MSGGRGVGGGEGSFVVGVDKVFFFFFRDVSSVGWGEGRVNFEMNQLKSKNITKQNKTKQNKTKQNKTKQNKNKIQISLILPPR